MEFEDAVNAYQVKYAINPNDTYVLDDFTNSDSKVFFKKFSDSWSSLKLRYPSRKIILHLLTNRSLDAELSNLITPDGFFSEDFVEGKKRKKPREIRRIIQDVTGLDESNFKNFLSCFKFCLKQLPLPNLIQHIKGDLLDHQLGYSDASIYQSLKEMIEDFAIDRHDALTPDIIDGILKRTQSRYLLPQVFEVEEELYIQRSKFENRLDNAIKNVDGDYIIITGLPGSGKSTSLTVYFDQKERSSHVGVIRYYCFTRINDNFQKQRLEAMSFRVNLLSAIQDKFQGHKQINLIRSFDYSENSFNQTLKILGEYFSSKNQKLIVFIDGLDHAERMKSEIRENLIDTLPRDIPKGIVFVLSTQELHKWPLFLRKTREHPDTHIELPFFTYEETRKYIVDRKQLQLSEDHVQSIYQKSDGLPLYLRYIVEQIRGVDDVDTELDKIPSLPDGDIKNYYEMLWQEFESYGTGKIQYLCGVLSCLCFPIHEDELFHFQKVISQPDFDDCFRSIQHLLKRRGRLVEIFHSSFREFVLSNLGQNSLQKIYLDISEYLNSNEGEDLWFSYGLEYAYRAGDYDYVIAKVNREFVDYALGRYRSNWDIDSALFWAVESAKEKSDTLALGRLSALKTRTRDRIENLDRGLLSKTLLTIGQTEDVIRYSYSFHRDQWLVGLNDALDILRELANQGKKEVGEQLFYALIESYSRSEITG